MRLPQLWTFASLLHPVYTRPPEATRWSFGDPRLRPREYTHEGEPARQEDFPVTEPLRTEMEGAPSLAVYQVPTTNYTVMSIRLNSRWAHRVDLSGLKALARQAWGLLKAMSRGPFTQKDLRRMDHPYGYGPARRGETPWQTLKRPRKIPTQPTRHFKGIRGSVANRDIVNLSTGQFERSWRWSVLPFAGGATVNLWNEARTEKGTPYPWFLYHGTRWMQAHGPWGKVAQIMLPRIHGDWRRETRRAQAAVVRELATRALEGGAAWPLQ